MANEVTEKAFSSLDSASQLDNTDIVAVSKVSGSSWISAKATLSALALKIATAFNFSSDLQTTAKTLTGAINEVAQGGGGGSSTLDGLNDVDIDDTTLADGQALVYDGTEEKWVNRQGGSGGSGHTILDDSGTSLAQEDDLQFKGTYSHDDSTNGKTVVEITREMTQAQYDLLSADEKKGIIRITDDDFVCDSTEVKYSSGVSVKNKLDEVDNIWSTTDTYWAIQTYKHNKIVQIRMEAQRDMSIGSGGGLVTTIPNISLPIETYVKCSNDSTSTDFVIHTDGKIYGTANTIKNGAIYNAIFLIN